MHRFVAQGVFTAVLLGAASPAAAETVFALFIADELEVKQVDGANVLLGSKNLGKYVFDVYGGPSFPAGPGKHRILVKREGEPDRVGVVTFKIGEAHTSPYDKARKGWCAEVTKTAVIQLSRAECRSRVSDGIAF